MESKPILKIQAIEEKLETILSNSRTLLEIECAKKETNKKGKRDGDSDIKIASAKGTNKKEKMDVDDSGGKMASAKGTSKKEKKDEDANIKMTSAKGTIKKENRNCDSDIKITSSKITNKQKKIDDDDDDSDTENKKTIIKSIIKNAEEAQKESKELEKELQKEQPKDKSSKSSWSFFSSRPSKTIYVLTPDATESTDLFHDHFSKKMKQMSVHLEKVDDVSGHTTDPLFVVCNVTSRLQPDIDHALEGISRSAPFAVIVLNIGRPGVEPKLSSSSRLTDIDKYKNIELIDMAYDRDSTIYDCPTNTVAFEKIKAFVANI